MEKFADARIYYPKEHQDAHDLARYAQHLQARIDALMLEYCPDEMTPEQIAEWERHQQAVPNAELRGRPLADGPA